MLNAEVLATENRPHISSCCSLMCHCLSCAFAPVFFCFLYEKFTASSRWRWLHAGVCSVRQDDAAASWACKTWSVPSASQKQWWVWAVGTGQQSTDTEQKPWENFLELHSGKDTRPGNARVAPAWTAWGSWAGSEGSILLVHSSGQPAPGLVRLWLSQN